MADKKIIWCFDDAHAWGSNLAQVAASRGHDARMFEEPRQPDRGYVFMHMHYHPQVRTLHKRIMQLMAMNPGLVLIPSYRSSVMFDDKAEQARQLARWMPRTHIYYTPNAARNALDKMKFPFVSKTAEGSSSNNVRFVQNADEARQEIRMAFSDIGIKCKYGQTQRGYLLWQEFIPGNEGDLRVLCVGNLRLVARRQNRAGMPVASSSMITPINDVGNADDITSAFGLADTFFAREHIRWGGVDMIQDQTTKDWHILETTVSWKMNDYSGCKFFDRNGAPVDLTGAKIWEALCGQIEAGAFDA